MVNKIIELRQEIADRLAIIDRIQEACSHPPDCVESKGNSSTGNWSKADDRYWTEYHCTLCDKNWTDDTR